MESELARWVEARGVVTQTEAAGFVAGEPIRGSWWGHPAGAAIYQALESLSEHPDVLSCKLKEGQSSFVHRRLWPALVVVQRASSLWPELSEEARELLSRVQREGQVSATGKVRLELERALRVLGVSEHTPSGAHRVQLVPFEAWVPPDVARAADALSVEEALVALEAAGFRSPEAEGRNGRSTRPATGKSVRSRRKPR
ncbi:MAG: hypothetical protein L0Y66_01820 [Myxococcaceae bacterium]|nr:hypothetical protein [Myxococcaceae bacterium]MCI0673023.1 hypothetical protein [Myxococcaceae bacterium]